MPMIRARYPDNWDEIALQVKDVANWRCTQCGKPCRKPGVEWLHFAFLADDARTLNGFRSLQRTMKKNPSDSLSRWPTWIRIHRIITQIISRLSVRALPFEI